MNIETRLPEALWDAVHSNYEKRNFTGAILDAFYFLSELLRNKSGIEGDGSALIGQALGGVTPKIKLNRLQTESEQNVQRGMEQMLRGLYQGIRNPRSHDKVSDSEDDAKTLIMFVGYIVKQIDQAKAQFSRSDFVRRVLDPDFVPQERYAELLVSEIPERVRLEVFLELYRENENWKTEHMQVFLEVFLRGMSEDDVRQICEVITDDLKTSDSESTIRVVLGSFPSHLWAMIGEAARLRIEHKVIRAVSEGRFDISSRRCRSGALGTWSVHIFKVMTLKTEMIQTIARQLWSSSPDSRAYVFEYIFNHMSDLSENVPPLISSAIGSRLKAGDLEFYDQMSFSPPWEHSVWPEELKKAYASFQVAEPANSLKDDIIPF